MSFKDLFKKSILNSLHNNTISMQNIGIVVISCILFGIFIYGIYYITQKKGFFSKQLGIVIAVLPIITAGIILAMQSNLIISLGMVGALSIVRFRTAIKEPKDILFLFWSISTGIILGAMNYGLALIIAIAVSFLMLFLELIPLGKASTLLVVNLNEKGNEEELMEIVKKYARISVIKSRSRKISGCDYIIECKSVKESELLEQIFLLDYVINASIIAHDGEAVY